MFNTQGFLDDHNEFVDDDGDDFAFDDGDEDYDEPLNGSSYPSSVGNDVSYFEADDYNIGNMGEIRKVEKVRVGYAKVAKKVDVKRLKKDLWHDLETRMSEIDVNIHDSSEDGSHHAKFDEESLSVEKEKDTSYIGSESDSKQKPISFQSVLRRLESEQEQEEVTLPFYFICVLHLANEKGLRLDSDGYGLSDFRITKDLD